MQALRDMEKPRSIVKSEYYSCPLCGYITESSPFMRYLDGQVSTVRWRCLKCSGDFIVKTWYPSKGGLKC